MSKSERAIREALAVRFDSEAREADELREGAPALADAMWRARVDAFTDAANIARGIEPDDAAAARLVLLLAARSERLTVTSDLLAACKAALEAWNSGEDCEVERIIRAAIAKAEGR